MYKLLEAFKQTHTQQAADRVVKHANKHPMSLCLLNPADILTYQAALYMTRNT